MDSVGLANSVAESSKSPCHPEHCDRSDGLESFGFEDHISQPLIVGLDPAPGRGEPLACLPGYIFVGRDGDPRKNVMPLWTHDGSFLVFRQLDEKVPEFNK